MLYSQVLKMELGNIGIEPRMDIKMISTAMVFILNKKKITSNATAIFH